jgi:hypothetical protein
MQATSFFGFGLDTYGAWGKRAEEYVELMAELAPVGGRGGRLMSKGEETAARGMIKRQLVECVATALAVGQARFVRQTHDRCVGAAARAAAGHDAHAVLAAAIGGVSGLAVGEAGGLMAGSAGGAERAGT